MQFNSFLEKSSFSALFVGVKEENEFSYRLCRWPWGLFPTLFYLIEIVYADGLVFLNKTIDAVHLSIRDLYFIHPKLVFYLFVFYFYNTKFNNHDTNCFRN